MVNLKDKQTNQIKQCKVGWSWTVFFFTWFPMLFRADWICAAIYVVFDVLVCVLGIQSDTMMVTMYFLGFVVRIAMSILYNRIYIAELIKKGWVPADDVSKKLLVAKNVKIPQDDQSATK